MDHELIWLAVTVGAALSAILWFALHLPWPTCNFRALTGLPCVTCGATRASLAFLHGDFGAALRFNPLIFAGICVIALFDLYALFVLSTGARRVRISLPKRGARNLLLAGVILLGLGNWIYLLRQ